MLQSINTIFWDRLSQPFVLVLKWKNGRQDAQGCYYQASHLVLRMYVFQQMARILCQTFVSDQLELLRYLFEEEQVDLSKANVACIVGVSFKEWVRDLQRSDDN